MRRRLSVIGLFVLSACGGGSTTGSQPATVSSVVLSVTTLALQTGQTGQLTATAKDGTGATVSGKTTNWNSSNDAVASVGSGGLVTANAAGSATITATIDSKSASAVVTVTAPTAAVASVTLSQATGTLSVDGTLQLVATPKDAQGNALSGRVIVWSSSAGAVASVSQTGLVTALGAGTATITASSAGKSATAVMTSTLGVPTPFLQKPFASEYLVLNIMDHDTPEEFISFNGKTITSWGEDVGTYDSHAGYDFMMPIGTPILAAAAGTVVTAAPATFFCPITNGDVTQNGVQIEHRIPGGNVYWTYYAHMSTVTVTVGQVVTAGQPIGLSGNTGCTTAPHLHFQLDRINGTNDGQLTIVDPYGWTGAGTDPWTLKPNGAVSLNLWKAGQAPVMSVGFDAVLKPMNDASSGPGLKPVAISRMSYMGDRDDLHPNNEWIEVQIDPAVVPGTTYDMTGVYLKNNANDRFTFPAGFMLTKGVPVKVFVGSGTNTATTLYWGKPAGIINNKGDCIELQYPNLTYYLFGWNVVCT